MISLLYYFYSFSIPFQEYLLPIADNLKLNPFIFLPLILSLFNKNLSYNPVNLSAFILFVFTLIFPRFDIVPQVLLFICFSYPFFLVRISKSSLRFALLGLKQVTYLVCFLVLSEIIVQLFFGSAGFSFIRNFYTVDYTSTNFYVQDNYLFLGYLRPITFFTEPSHCAVYLCLVNLIFSINKDIHYPKLLKILIILSVFTLGSLSGMILLIVTELSCFLNYNFSNSFSFKGFIIKYNIKTLFKSFLYSSSVLLFPIYLFLSQANRFKSITHALFTSSLIAGGEAERLGAFIPCYDLLFSNNYLFGLGLGNTTQYLSDNYPYISSFAAGKIPNMMANLILTFGFLGFLLIALSFFILFKNISLVNLTVIFSFLFFLSFTMGNFYNSYIWQPLFILVNVLYLQRLNSKSTYFS